LIFITSIFDQEGQFQRMFFAKLAGELSIASEKYRHAPMQQPL
jgi:hypothetical protein